MQSLVKTGDTRLLISLHSSPASMNIILSRYSWPTSIFLLSVKWSKSLMKICLASSRSVRTRKGVQKKKYPTRPLSLCLEFGDVDCQF